MKIKSVKKTSPEILKNVWKFRNNFFDEIIIFYILKG